MRHVGPAVLIVLALASCGGSPPAEQPQQRIEDPEAVIDDLPVMGQERHIAVLAKGVLDGRGLARDDAYPTLLEGVLRVKGINARIVTVKGGPGTGADRPDLIVAGDPADPALAAWRAAGIPVVTPDFAAVLKAQAGLLAPDGIHPNAQGVEDMARATVKPIGEALPQ